MVFYGAFLRVFYVAVLGLPTWDSLRTHAHFAYLGGIYGAFYVTLRDGFSS
jgi:hypothetical protein